ncbi:MAG: mechanosensitive ion channel [Alcaligenaceae bacterium]|nr:mechanosensitive ion channel [Alcaligenaceae bacterium]
MNGTAELFKLLDIQLSDNLSVWLGLVIILVVSGVLYGLVLLACRYLNRWMSNVRFSVLKLIPQFKLFRQIGFVLLSVIFGTLCVIMLPEGRISSFCLTVSGLGILFFILMTIFAILNITLRWCHLKRWGRDLPLSGIFQTLKLMSAIVIGLLMVSTVFDQSPVYMLSGLGVITSVLLLVFKEPLLGLVAGIQLSANRTLKEGDWMEMPSHLVDGNVENIGLTTIKVMNWDNTSTIVPTSALLSNPFKNWRSMQESGGRRIKRAFYVDTASVRFLTQEEKQNYIARFPCLKDPFEMHMGDVSNLSAFRYFMTDYLNKHPMISDHFTRMVRMLPIEAKGIPVEVYCFTRTIEWVVYESIQSAIMEFVYASLDMFELSAYQALGGSLKNTPIEV